MFSLLTMNTGKSWRVQSEIKPEANARFKRSFAKAGWGVYKLCKSLFISRVASIS